MPLPLIPIILGSIFVAGSGTGIYKSVKANRNTNKAKKANAKALKIINHSKGVLDYSRKISGKSLEKLGLQKASILDKSINSFVRVFEQIKNVELNDSIGIQEAKKIQNEKIQLNDFKELGNLGTSIISGVGAGALGGALTAYGAYGAVGLVAKASTGILISELSGAAATNATLAFFGGGSLAAGGLGIAGGTVVLGGVIAGPALAIMGFIMDAKATKDVENALTNIKLAQKNAKEMEVATELCQAIKRRSEMFFKKLSELDTRLTDMTSKLDAYITQNGTDYFSYSEEGKGLVAANVSLAIAVKSIIDTPLLTKDGNLTKESEHILNEI